MAQNKVMGNIVVKPFRTYKYKENLVIDNRTGEKYHLDLFLQGKWERAKIGEK